MQPFPLDYEPAVPMPQMVLRSRKEVSTRDAVNARQFEHWQTDAPYMDLNRPDKNREPAHLDMNPVPSRNSASSAYRQNATLKAGADGFTQNPYFENYSPADDSRNVIREFRAAVFEEKEDRGIAESKRILTREFQSIWVPQAVIEKKNLTTLHAYEELKPVFDNPATNYRKR